MKYLIKKWWLLLLVATALLGAGCSANSFEKLARKITNEEKYYESIGESTQREFEKNVLIPVQLVRHIDGDTSIFLINGQEETVRYLLIDTPETVKKNTPVQLFGSEASNRTKELLETASVIEIMLDKGEERDRTESRRLLAYVFVDGELVQDILVREGFARVAYVHEPSTTYLQQLEQSQEQAKQQEIGIWSIAGYVTDRGFQE